MFEKFFQGMEISFENFIAVVTGSSYKKEWEQQNIELDHMSVMRNKEKARYENTIKTKNADITQLQLKQENLKNELSKSKEKYQKYKTMKDKEYLDLMNKYQDVTLKLQDVALEKRKLASSKGGLNSKIRHQELKIKKYETENKEIKKLLQKIIQESKRKLTPATRKELENYNLFGNRKGKRR